MSEYHDLFVDKFSGSVFDQQIIKIAVCRSILLHEKISANSYFDDLLIDFILSAVRPRHSWRGCKAHEVYYHESF